MPTFRFHRGYFNDSMETCVVVNNKKELWEIIQHDRFGLGEYEFKKFIGTPDNIIIRPYIFDDRNGWNTHIVLIKPRCVTEDCYPVGFLSDKFLEEE